jgi:hypothetical protein
MLNVDRFNFFAKVAVEESQEGVQELPLILTRRTTAKLSNYDFTQSSFNPNPAFVTLV